MTRFADFILDNRFIVLLLTGLAIAIGMATAPFDWDLRIPQDRVPVDAIPNYGEAQQIVFTEWPGRSPEDVEDQVTYPLTVELLGIPGVKTVRSTSMFGFSMINVIMEDDVDFYWSRSRILEKLASLPGGALPDGVKPALGPDATALGQIYWYTIEGRSPDGETVGGWSLEELRSFQDFYVKPALNSAPGISEVASVGGYVREYQIDVDPKALDVWDVTLDQVVRAVKQSNRDVGARTIEINQMEYVIRGLGQIEDLEDVREVVIRTVEGVPVHVSDVANVHFGPALRRGALDKNGAEAVGGVAVVRYGDNPMEAIQRLKEKIAELQPGMPTKTLDDGTVSQMTIVPFYDRTELIHETLGTLENALTDEILITILVVVVMLLNLRTSVLVAGLLPLAVLMTFIAMKLIGIEANILALSGIAIAIGTMVDMGIVVTENMVAHMARAPDDEPRRVTLARAVGEVGGAVLTAVATTVVSFIPVFGLQAAEGKLFGPLAWTKTLALVMAVIVALVVLPPVALSLFAKAPKRMPRVTFPKWTRIGMSVFAALLAAFFLARHWMPLGLGESDLVNFIFVVLLVGVLLAILLVFQWVYPRLLKLALDYKVIFLAVPGTLVLLGLTVWLGAQSTLGWLPDDWTSGVQERMPGLEGEFMPKLDEGSFLYMPTTMPHASIGATLDVMQEVDRRIAAIPEVKDAVGKLGRVESALDPAPVSMLEVVITLEDEWTVHDDGTRTRNWRDHIERSEDIWDEIIDVAKMPELTSAPMLQPIETRIVMLQTGMRASMGVKVFGPDLETIEDFAMEIEGILKEVPEISAPSVLADRIVGKPYLEVRPDRQALGRYGLRIEDIQQVVEVAIGGKPLTRTIEGRESYPVRVRYPPELRLTPDDIGEILVDTPSGAQIPLQELASVDYEPGPQLIRSEDTFKVGYVTFGPAGGASLTEVVESARATIQERIDAGELEVPPAVTWKFAGKWESKVRSDERLAVLIPLALVVVFILLHLQFRSIPTTLMVFSGVIVAVSGGFVMLWAWQQPWFLDFSVFGHDMRDVFGVQPINLSVAVWVGFIALIGIAVDDGVVMATYLDQRFRRDPPTTLGEITEAVMDAGKRRIRPCLMTTGTTVIALLPILTSQGRGADVMIPMALPAFGGMAFELVTLFVVPVLYGAWQATKLRFAPEREPEPEQVALPLS
ncbi:MAG: efflux RND transporter permease subunit [Myxococcota bacterium]